MSCRHFCHNFWSLESSPSCFPGSCDALHLSFPFLNEIWGTQLYFLVVLEVKSPKSISLRQSQGAGRFFCFCCCLIVFCHLWLPVLVGLCLLPPLPKLIISILVLSSHHLLLTLNSSLQYWLEVWDGSHGAAVQVLAGLHSFLEPLREKPFPCLFQLLEAVHSLAHCSFLHLQSQPGQAESSSPLTLMPSALLFYFAGSLWHWST